MKKKLWVSLISLFFSSVIFASSKTIQDIKIIKLSTASRLQIAMDNVASPRIFTLTNPDRLVIDFNDDVILKPRLSTIALSPEIKNLRSGHPKPHVFRLVVEMKQSLASFKTLPQADKNVLMVDLKPLSKTIAHVDQALTHALLTAPRKDPVVVVIDPGHGGKDPGAVGIHGTQEKDIVLAIAERFAELVNQQPGMRAVLTRNGDYFVPLRNRLRLARKGKADLFIAIHADSYFNKQSHGTSVYALSQRGATSEAGRWLARRDNDSELGGVDLSELQDQSVLLRSVLIDLAQTATINDSLRLGSGLLKTLQNVTKLHYRHVEQAPFVVLKSPDIPSVLVETGFISNTDEELRLRNKNYQNQIAKALFEGVHQYTLRYLALAASKHEVA